MKHSLLTLAVLLLLLGHSAPAQDPPAASQPESAAQRLEKRKANLESELEKNSQALTDASEPKPRRELLTQRFDLLASGAQQGLIETSQIEQFLNDLASDSDSAVVEKAKEWTLSFNISKLNKIPAKDRREQINELLPQLLAAPASQSNIQAASQLGSLAQKSFERKDCIELYKTLSTHYSSVPNNQFAKTYSDIFAALAVRLDLPGHPFVLSCPTLDGEPFDVKDLKGKVVLVDFWATWCKPCIAEFPNMKRLYEIYHPHGFEIVSISVDWDRERLEKYLEEKPLPWILLHDQENKGRNQAVKDYGVNAIPWMVLIGTDGNVITIDARGHNLDQELSKLFPDVSTKPEPSSEGNTSTSLNP